MHLTTILSFYNLAKLLNFVVWKVHFWGFCQTQIQKNGLSLLNNGIQSY
ncbi:hypothetical protein CMALT394_450021 [Carnobacterium maltaromaticum]|nr:hypothetical protein CMALT394_450021 [Carnobacterium maltaromaticum]